MMKTQIFTLTLLTLLGLALILLHKAVTKRRNSLALVLVPGPFSRKTKNENEGLALGKPGKDRNEK